MNKVTFQNSGSYTAILVDGKRAGNITKGDPGQVWVELVEEPWAPEDLKGNGGTRDYPHSEFAARIRGGRVAKGMPNSRVIAKRIFKYVLERVTTQEYLSALKKGQAENLDALKILFPNYDAAMVESGGKITDAQWSAKVKASWAAHDAEKTAHIAEKS